MKGGGNRKKGVQKETDEWAMKRGQVEEPICAGRLFSVKPSKEFCHPHRKSTKTVTIKLQGKTNHIQGNLNVQRRSL